MIRRASSPRLLQPSRMRNTLLLASCLITLSAWLPAQQIRVLKVKSPILDIQDGDRLLEGVWRVDPTIPLDVYDAQRSSLQRRVTFVGDGGSLSFDVEPGRTYDFAIEVAGQPACITRISTMTQPFTRTASAPANGPIAMPITVSRGKLHLQGAINGVDGIDLILDTGASVGGVYPGGVAKGVALQFDGSVENRATGGTTVRRKSSDNTLEIAGLRWDHECLLEFDLLFDGADAIVGMGLFDGHVVELDFERMLLTVHDQVPAHAAAFAATPIHFVGDLPAIDVVFGDEAGTASGVFVIDTAGNGAMFVNRPFAAAHDLFQRLPSEGTSTSTGLGPDAITNDVVKVPSLTIAGMKLQDVPIHVARNSPTDEPPGGVVCMDVLQRGHWLLDYPRRQVLWKANSLAATPIPLRLAWPRWWLVGGGAALLALAVLAVSLARRRRRHGE